MSDPQPPTYFFPFFTHEDATKILFGDPDEPNAPVGIMNHGSLRQPKPQIVKAPFRPSWDRRSRQAHAKKDA